MDSERLTAMLDADAELLRLLPLIDDVTIIEYNANDVRGCVALHSYLKSKSIDNSIVRRIVLLGKTTGKRRSSRYSLSSLYPNAEVTTVVKPWQRTAPETLKVRSTLVIHIGIAAGIADYMLDNELFSNFVDKTSRAYFLCLLNKHAETLFDNPYTKITRLRLSGSVQNSGFAAGVPTAFCKDKQEYIRSCIKTLVARDAFFYCIDEAAHGCEKCNQCSNYDKQKRCPYAQRSVAEFYREGLFVPKDKKIAHQWELMAAHQGYRPACIQVADDLSDGAGCDRDIEAALGMYERCASHDDAYCTGKIIRIVENEQGINPIVAVPYITLMAQSGDEDMMIRLADAFQNGDFGLPKDIVQQEEWVRQGADNRNPRFVKYLAEMYENSTQWAEAYQWYKILEELDADPAIKTKLEEVELRMLTYGMTPEEVAVNGENYLFGHFGKERNLRLAYHCLKYASDKGVAMAIGRLGVMYLEGLHVAQDIKRGIDLLTSAAENDDLRSIDDLVSLHAAGRYGYHDGERWERVAMDKIEEGITRKSPLAYGLKGRWILGHLHEGDVERNKKAAFENIEKAAAMGLLQAQYDLYVLYRDGLGCSCDRLMAHAWLMRAANNGYRDAEEEYGEELFAGSEQTRNNSVEYLRRAYEKGSERVVWSLAQCYMFGYGTDVRKDLAYPLYQRAAEDGKREAQERLCIKYYWGDDFLPKSYDLCAKWGEEAIRRGSKEVRFNTAYSLSKLGNKKRAKELYAELANEGDALAMNNLGCLEDDKTLAAELFLKAADKGDEVAQYNIARYYRYGIAMDKDEAKALDYYTKSAQQGYITAIKELGDIFRYGSCGQERDIEKAIDWYEKAVKQSDEEAMIALANIYGDASHNLCNAEKAVSYYKMAAEKGNSTAAYRLGELYERGESLEKDIKKAVYWYRKAAVKNYDDAKESLRRLHANWIDADGNFVDNRKE